MESKKLTVLAQGNFTECCEQGNKVMVFRLAIHLITYLLWSTIMFEKLSGSQLVNKFLHFTDPEV
jgi:hypothetical protein